MDYKEAYQEYCREHPEELAGINALKRRTAIIEEERRSRAAEKLALIEQCRRKLYG